MQAMAGLDGAARTRDTSGMRAITADVIEQRAVAGGGYRRLVLDAADVAAAARPGQFVHIRAPGLDAAVLRRPFSIHGVADGRLDILYKTVGRGTDAMARLGTGDRVSLLGPLGNGFPTDVPREARAVLVAGGYGVAPLSFLASQLAAPGIVFIGGATAGDLLCDDEFRERGWEVVLTTEDGSRGDRGRVTVALDRYLAAAMGALIFFACGPDGMLKAVGERAIVRGDRAWLSLDKHMGCGVGACLACVQAVRDAEGRVFWQRVCRDGPVFDARRVVWQHGD